MDQGLQLICQGGQVLKRAIVQVPGDHQPLFFPLLEQPVMQLNFPFDRPEDVRMRTFQGDIFDNRDCPIPADRQVDNRDCTYQDEPLFSIRADDGSINCKEDLPVDRGADGRQLARLVTRPIGPIYPGKISNSWNNGSGEPKMASTF